MSALGRFTRLSRTIAGRRSLQGQSRRFNATRPVASSSYVSPFQDFFDEIEQGRTSIGVADDDPSIRSLLHDNPKNPTPRLKCGISEEVIHFETMVLFRQGISTPFVDPEEFKMAILVDMKDLPFESDLERRIMQQLVGPRRWFVSKEQRGRRTGDDFKSLGPEAITIKLSSNHFASRIENKRHLIHMLDRLVLSAKELASEAESEQSSA